MIKELADFEKALDRVQATESTLLNTLSFAPTASNPKPKPGYAYTVLLTLPSHESPDNTKDQICAMAMYFNNYSTWRAKPGVYLEDLFVRPQFRKRGYGKMLIQALAQEVLRIDGGRLEWCCLRWNESSLRFYDSLGAKQMTDWVSLRVDGKELEDLAMGRTRALKSES